MKVRKLISISDWVHEALKSDAKENHRNANAQIETILEEHYASVKANFDRGYDAKVKTQSTVGG